MKRRFKQALAAMLSLTLILTTFLTLPIFTANAASERIDITLIDYPRGGGTDTWGHPALTLMNGWSLHSTPRFSAKAAENKNMQVAYCVQPNAPLYSGDSSPEILPENFLDTYDNGALSNTDIQQLIGRIFQYGFTEKVTVSHTNDEMSNMIATQVLVWEVIVGERSPDFSKITPPAGISGCLDTVTSAHPLRSEILVHYNRIANSVANHSKIPSFMRKGSATAATHELTWDGSAYSVTLTDANGVLSNFTFSSATPGVSFSVSGNQLKISTSSPPSGTISIEANRTGLKRSAITFWASGKIIVKNQVQGLVMSGQEIADPVGGYVNVKVNTGNLSIIKTSQHNNGTVSGFTFEVRNSAGTLIGTYTSTESGKIDIVGLQPGTYSVKEVNLSSDFVEPSPNPKTVEIRGGNTSSVSFDNIRKRGVITIQKVNSTPSMGDYSLAGAIFEIRDQGNNLVDTVTVPASGIGQSKILPLGVYRITEKSSPPTGGFVRNTEIYTAALSGSLGSVDVVYAPNTVIPEMPQVARINIEKYNSDLAMGDYSLKGTTFEIFYPNGNLADSVIVDENGKGQSKDLPLGKGYKVIEKTASYGFARNKNTYAVDLNYGGEDKTVIYETVKIPERPQTGRIKIYKYNSASDLGDYDLKGAKFEIRNTATGDLMDTVVVDSAGYGISKELPLTAAGRYQYSCREVTAPWGFTLTTQTFYPVLSYAGQEAEITYTDVTVPQRPQTGKITIEKQDSYNGRTPSGDADLRGAIFEIYAGQDIKKLDGSYIYRKDQLVDTLYCGNDTKATSKELPLGTYYWRESSPPPIGYTPDQTPNEIKIEYQGQNVSTVYLDREKKINKPIEGQISIVKHTTLPDPNVNPEDPQIEKPIQATFEIYLAKAGSYKDAKEREKDLITTDPENGGYAISKKFPYGLYWVVEKEAKNPDGTDADVKLVEPFTVMINQEGKVYRYILNDIFFESLVKIRKIDSTTGKTIPAAGVSFKVWDVANNRWVKQHYNYPVPTDIEIYETSGDGTLVMPEALPSGDYLLYEQPGSAPYGYVFSKDPVPFTIHSTQQDPVILEVWMANKPAMGVIEINKTGQVLTGVQQIQTKFGTQYIPIFSQAFVSGQIFDIIAKTDIITPDGTLRYAKGSVVDTVKIINGTGKSKQLFLGDFLVVERDCGGEPFIKNGNQYPVSLVYENENVEVVTSSVTIENIRQQLEIELQKMMERPVNAPNGFNAFADVVFGVFADEPIRDHVGNIVIPKDGLIALMTLDDNGKSTLSGEMTFSKVYVKEIQTNYFYQLNPTKYPLDIKYQGESVTKAKFQLNNGGIAIPNETKLGRIVVEKQGEMLVGAIERNGKTGSIYTPVYEIKALPGVTFCVICDEDIYDVYGKLVHKKGDEVDRITSGPNGKAESKLLRLGRYLLIEDVPYGYVAENNRYAVTLGFDGEVSDIITKTVRIENQRQKAEVDLTKLCEIPENAPDDFNPYRDITFGIFAAEDIKTPDGKTVIPKDGLIEMLTFEDGGAGGAKAVMKTDLTFSSYYAKELYSGSGYDLPDTRYHFTFEYNSEVGAVIPIHINNGKPIENKLLRGSLKIIKTFEGREFPIENVPFTIVGTVTATGKEITIKAKTDANGEILLEGLLVGNYKILELESDLTIGYVLSPEENAVVAADEIVEMSINNRLQIGDLKIIKTFEGKTSPIAGVKFTITGTSITGIPFRGQFETDSTGCILIEGLPVGEYKILELASDLTAGYVLSEEQTTIIAANEITEMTIYNKKIQGQLRIFKYTDTDTPIAGAVFGIYNEKGELVEELTSGQDGYCTSSLLESGEYTVKELSTVKGFILNQTPFEMEITENGRTYDLKFKNERIPEKPSNPKTGDSSNLPLWLGLAAASIGGIVLTLATKKRKNSRTH